MSQPTHHTVHAIEGRGDIMDRQWPVEPLPLKIDLETKKVLKALAPAHRALAELKGLAMTIPNQNILINSLTLREARDSSAIESIVTTMDDLYESTLDLPSDASLDTKEVHRYADALKMGHDIFSKDKVIRNSLVLKIQQVLEENDAGYRSQAGTELKNSVDGSVIYTPPQERKNIQKLMNNLLDYLNDDSLAEWDPLIKMAVIHHQFKSIHPFYDGNGRTGRILNILYLVKQGLLNLPVLYLSNYIIDHKSDYYRLLQEVRTDGKWEEWVLFMIEGVRSVALDTIRLITEIKKLMLVIKNELRDNYKFYSQDLINNLFKYPYTKIDFLVDDLQVSRVTAANYLNKLADDGILIKRQKGTANYYVNHRLYAILTAP